MLRQQGGRTRSSLSTALTEAVRSHQAGRLSEAARLYDHILKTDPKHSDALHLRGLVASQQGHHDRALALVRKAIAIAPGNAAYRNTLGNVLLALDNAEDAEASFRIAVELDPGLAEAHNNLGNALLRLDRPDESLGCYRRALELRPGYAEAHCNLGSALRKLGRLDEPQARYEQALALKPEYATALSNLGQTLHERAHYREALVALDKAITVDPAHADAHANRAVLLLLLGRFAEGWVEYEWRWKVAGFTTEHRDFSRPRWDGSNLDGRTILLHAEQGLGSAIQFVRYAPLIAARNGTVVLECPKSLVRLFSSLTVGQPPPVKSVVARGEALPPYNVHAPLMSLPALLGTEIDTIPREIPYLAAEPAVAAAWRDRLASFEGLRVGLAWAGNPRHANDRNRSMPASVLQPLVHAGGATFFSLQVGSAAQDLDGFAGGSVHDLAPQIGDFADTAAIVANLDLVVSVDTAVAHLAGALGRPVWLLLPFVGEWRWLLDREDTPWYPTMRLFRQRAPGDWSGVVDRVIEALAAVSTGR
jgi:tetratricopeptide (TPR) repeat protein